jgi:hypothetical protein
MVHIHSITASYHPSRQEQVSDSEATSCSRAGRPHHGGGRSTAIARVDTTQRQHSISVAIAPPPMATTKATMHAVHQLLNNPPPSGASPLAMEQLRHDVDQLVITAINTPHPRGNCQPLAGHLFTPPQASWASRVPSAVCPPLAAWRPLVARVPTAACAPSGPRVTVSSITTGDLRDELCHHEGEDSGVTIERWRERCRNIKARNLEKDFSTISPVREAPGASGWMHDDLPQLSNRFRVDAWLSHLTSAW